MKKTCLAILTLLYSVASSGIAMEIHYCMGKEAGIDLYGHGSEKCGICGMKEKKSSCCFDEHRFCKLTDSHKTVSNNIEFGVYTYPTINSVSQYILQCPSFRAFVDVYFSHPPGPPGIPLFLRNRVFRL